MERMKIEVYSSKTLEVMENGFPRISSAPSYDRHLSAVFPNFALVSHRQAQELVGVLMRGYEYGPGKFGPTSFSVAFNMRGEKFNRPIVLWMSAASVATLQQHKDIYEIAELDGQPVMSPVPEGE